MGVDQPLQRGSKQPSSQTDQGPQQPTVIIVDDDAAIREALADLLQSAGFSSTCFASTAALFEADALEAPGCLVLDVRMPGASGLDLQRRMVQRGDVKPIIFLTGHGDIPMSVQAMKAGAVDFLTKPVRDQDLLDAITSAIALDAERRARGIVIERNIQRLKGLTQREREVLQEVVRGRQNKQIAFDLGISDVTVKLHRSNAMRKMGISSVGELVRIWEALPATARDIARE
ncbi:MAG: response regulator transcription factor [Ferrovibrio sp.]|uniref:response regulator transcription factor n=1 Tax=Ferrovibrio sp. TaxID=1917215 RepID=UPI0026156BF4|nr:response regulator transcription factor [Ferrovibrio sp.]MCW0236289.1 response regulator transcription factor [Ferrovibrio sp.]